MPPKRVASSAVYSKTDQIDELEGVVKPGSVIDEVYTEHWDSEFFNWTAQFAGAFVLYFVAQHAAVSNLEVYNQAIIYSMVFVLLSFVAPGYKFDSLFIMWKLIKTAFKQPPAETAVQAVKSIVAIGMLLLASVTATMATHWHTKDYRFVGNPKPHAWITTYQAIFYEALFRIVLVVVLNEAKHLAQRTCLCATHQHEQPCTRTIGVWGASPFIAGFAVAVVFYCTSTSSGGSVDVIRAMGPALMSGDWTGVLNAFIGQSGAQLVVESLYLLRNHVTIDGTKKRQAAK